MRVSFDFDDTMSLDGRPNLVIIDLINEYAADGHTCIIVTARSKDFYNLQEINAFILEWQLPIVEVYFTNHELKGDTLRKVKADEHYDDADHHLESAKGSRVRAFRVMREIIEEYRPDAIH